MLKEVAYYDGHWGDPREIMIPFYDRSHFFGDGVYDATIGSNGKAYLLEDHLDRFYTSAKLFEINIPMEKPALGRLIEEMMGKIEAKTSFVYWQVTRGVGPRMHAYDENMPGKIWIFIRPCQPGNPDKPYKLVTRPDTRFEHCNAKTLNLLPAVFASQKAEKAGADETVYYRGNLVTECAHNNVCILKDGILYSHPNDQYILRGIAQTHLIQACWRLGIPVIERPFTLEELFNADEIIVSASSSFGIHADTIDGQKVGCKDPVTYGKIRQEVVKEYLEYTGRTTLFD